MISSTEVEVALSQRKQSTSLYWWMHETWISWARVETGVSTACLLVSCGVMVGSKQWHHVSSPTKIQHIALSMVPVQMFQQYWHAMPLAYVCVKKWDLLGVHSVMSMISYNCMHSANACIQFYDRKKVIQHLSSCSEFLTHTMFSWLAKI
jgi:hypothetical protein